MEIKKIYDEVKDLQAKKDTDMNAKSDLRHILNNSISTVLEYVSTKCGHKFSLFKEGQNYDSMLNPINTQVRKTKEEVLAELDSIGSDEDIKQVKFIIESYLDL